MTTEPASWASRREAARELSEILGRNITPVTLREWRTNQQCPIPHRGPIPRAPVLAWLVLHKRDVGRPKGAGVQHDDGGEAELRKAKISEDIRRLRMENERREHLSLPREEARAETIRTIGEMKRELLQEFPGDVLEMLGVPATVDNTKRVCDMLSAALNRAVDRLTSALDKIAEAS